MSTDFSRPPDRFSAASTLPSSTLLIPAAALADSGESETRYQLETDLSAYLICAQEAARRMESGSDILFIGSMSAVSQKPGSSIYIAAKASIEGFVPAFRKELAEEDIKVGLIEPRLTGADFQYPEFPPEKQKELIPASTRCCAPRISRSRHTSCSPSRAAPRSR